MSSTTLPESARIVIIGGGIVGCSIAYHLALRGERDVLLLERAELTSGTTWHAAGLVGQLRSTRNLTRLAQYTTELFTTLGERTGQATGFRQCGSVSIATNADRMEELRRGASMARAFGLPVEVITTAQVAELAPITHLDDIVGGVHLPGDGVTNPVDTTRALARGARDLGVRIREHTPVERVLVESGRVVGVRCRQGDATVDVRAEAVVNAAGMWARELVHDLGVNVPLHAAEHFYVVTEEIPGLPSGLPVVRDQDGCAYIKQEAGKLLIGWFEPVAKPWGMRVPGGAGGVPRDFTFGTLPEDLEHITPLLEMAAHRVPLLEDAGIRLFFNGPESFTPDDRYLLGETPEVSGLFLACGFNSIGIQSSGGAGKVLADWIVDGHPPMDLWDVDVRRMMPFQSNSAYLHDRTVETLGLLYAMHWPFRQPETARGVRRSVLHDRLAGQGACFGETAGWERANWFAPAGIEPRYAYSYGRQNWFEHSAAEHRAVRETVGLFDQSSFACFQVSGRDAQDVLNRICANEVAVEVGRIVYTQWLNERGTIEADVTVTRQALDEYLVVTSAACQTRDLAWLRAHIPAGARASVVDLTSGLSVLGVMGPRSRDLLQSLTPDDLSNGSFPFAHSRTIELGYAQVRASRITYVGELGWELYIPSEYAMGIFDALMSAGPRFGLRLAGYHALNSLRLEKAYRHWGHDISPDDTPLEAGLGFAVAWDKPGGFIGRDALLRQREHGISQRLVQFRLADDAPFAYHNEPIWRDDQLVGHVTSGMYGHTVGAPIALGYVARPDGPADAEWLLAGAYEVEIACERFPAQPSLRPLVDPANERIRS
ncbi:MAG: FAD-dependent oxidoreductase [Actinomycetales bacterium]|nr:FAD-dependent oxidoreductase [Actinomycetales bacterium]